MSLARSILLGCYFPRSVALEGVGSLMRGLASHLAARGCDVRVLLPEGQYPPVEGVKLLTYRPGTFGIGRYKRAIREHSRDASIVVLIENNPNMIGSADASCQPLGTLSYFCTPLQDLGLLQQIGWSRQALLHAVTKHKLLARMRNWSNRRCVVGSHFQADQLRLLGAKNVDVLPVCGFSRRARMPSRSEARASLGWSNGPVVGYLGHYSQAKGVDVLVEAFATYDGPGKLALACSGKGNLRPRSQKLLDELRASGRVIEHGVVDPVTFLAACDATALPYVTSSIFHQPQVLIESFAASTPVVTSDLGGFGEMVRQGETGMLVPAGDAKLLAAAIQKLLADLPRAHAMGLNGRQLFESAGCVESFAEYLERQVP